MRERYAGRCEYQADSMRKGQQVDMVVVGVGCRVCHSGFRTERDLLRVIPPKLSGLEPKSVYFTLKGYSALCWCHVQDFRLVAPDVAPFVTQYDVADLLHC